MSSEKLKYPIVKVSEELADIYFKKPTEILKPEPPKEPVYISLPSPPIKPECGKAPSKNFEYQSSLSGWMASSLLIIGIAHIYGRLTLNFWILIISVVVGGFLLLISIDDSKSRSSSIGSNELTFTILIMIAMFLICITYGLICIIPIPIVLLWDNHNKKVQLNQWRASIVEFERKCEKGNSEYLIDIEKYENLCNEIKLKNVELQERYKVDYTLYQELIDKIEVQTIYDKSIEGLRNYRLSLLRKYLLEGSIDDVVSDEKAAVKRGISENVFFNAVRNRFPKAYQNVSINIDDSSKLFYPDILILITPNSGNLFVVIVEIDEPYLISNGMPIHFKNNFLDIKRDGYLCSKHWIVVRFTERQVVEQSSFCIDYISRVVENLSDVSSPLDKKNWEFKGTWEYQWTKSEANQLAYQKFRNKYLDNISILNEHDITDYQEYSDVLSKNLAEHAYYLIANQTTIDWQDAGYAIPSDELTDVGFLFPIREDIDERSSYDDDLPF